MDSVGGVFNFLLGWREDEQYDKEAEILGKGGCGLVLVKDRTGCLYVWMQQRGGPAHRSGQIEAGDLLQRVQNIDADGTVAEGPASLAGLEGTAVQLSFKRGFHSADIWAVKLRRMKGCDDELALAAPGFEFPSMGPAPVSAVVASAPPPPQTPVDDYHPERSSFARGYEWNTAPRAHIEEATPLQPDVLPYVPPPDRPVISPPRPRPQPAPAPYKREVYVPPPPTFYDKFYRGSSVPALSGEHPIVVPILEPVDEIDDDTLLQAVAVSAPRSGASSVAESLLNTRKSSAMPSAYSSAASSGIVHMRGRVDSPLNSRSVSFATSDALEDAISKMLTADVGTFDQPNAFDQLAGYRASSPSQSPHTIVASSDFRAFAPNDMESVLLGLEKSTQPSRIQIPATRVADPILSPRSPPPPPLREIVKTEPDELLVGASLRGLPASSIKEYARIQDRNSAQPVFPVNTRLERKEAGASVKTGYVKGIAQAGGLGGSAKGFVMQFTTSMKIGSEMAHVQTYHDTSSPYTSSHTSAANSRAASHSNTPRGIPNLSGPEDTKRSNRSTASFPTLSPPPPSPPDSGSIGQQWKSGGYVDDRPIISNFPGNGDVSNAKHTGPQGEVLLQDSLEGPSGTPASDAPNSSSSLDGFPDSAPNSSAPPSSPTARDEYI